MYKVIVHIGMPKCGSTSIQNYLIKNHTKLAKKGFGFLTCLGRGNQKALAYYAKDPTRIGSRQPILNLKKLGLSQYQTHEEMQAGIEERIHAQIESLPRSVHTLVFSSELLTRLEPEQVGALQALFATFSRSTTILLYLREQAAYIESSFTTSLRGGKRHTLNDHYQHKRSLHYLRYDRMIKCWEDVFGEDSLCPRLFSKADLHDGDAVADFCAATNIPHLPTHEDEQSSNKSLDMDILYQIRGVNRQLKNRELNRAAMRAIEVMQLTLGSSDFSGRKVALPPEILASIEAEFAASNEAVRRRFFPDRVRLFEPRHSDPNAVNGEDPSGLGRTDFLEALIQNLLQRRLSLEDVKKP